LVPGIFRKLILFAWWGRVLKIQNGNSGGLDPKSRTDGRRKLIIGRKKAHDRGDP